MRTSDVSTVASKRSWLQRVKFQAYREEFLLLRGARTWSPAGMVHAQVLYLLLFACVSQSHCASTIAKRNPMLNAKCLKEPTVEGCDTILLSWSFSSETKTCEKGFVCSDCANRFDNQNECTTVCANVQVRKRKRSKKNCRYWLVWGASCQDMWFEFRKNKAGIMRRLLFYYGCGPDKDKLFKYDFYRKKCNAVKNRLRKNQSNNENGSSGVAVRGGRHTPLSSGISNAAATA